MYPAFIMTTMRKMIKTEIKNASNKNGKKNNAPKKVIKTKLMRARFVRSLLVKKTINDPKMVNGKINQKNNEKKTQKTINGVMMMTGKKRKKNPSQNTPNPKGGRSSCACTRRFIFPSIFFSMSCSRDKMPSSRMFFIISCNFYRCKRNAPTCPFPSRRKCHQRYSHLVGLPSFVPCCFYL